jgi:aspartyl-tRNA(Asn)/glutamyl-tRNA(Gln) amidotransferase subunit C
LSLSQDDLIKLAKLSRLSLSTQEAESLRESISSIVDWVGQLQQAPVDGIEPMAHPHDQAMRLREDAPVQLEDREVLMSNAAERAAGFFLVPKVLD